MFLQYWLKFDLTNKNLFLFINNFFISDMLIHFLLNGK